MKNLLIILSLFLTLTVSAQVRYSTTKTVWNFRTSSVKGQKPVSQDFSGVTNARLNNTADSLLWFKTNNVITPTYTYYPYSATKVTKYAVVVTSTARYTYPKYQNYVRTSNIKGNVPILADFTDATIMCWNSADSCIYQKVNGVIKKTWKIYPYANLQSPCSFTYSAWSDCGTNGMRTRTLATKAPISCSGIPVLSEPCSYTVPSCTYTYSAWSSCLPNGTQTRTVTSSSPSGCTGTPTLVQNCTYIPPTCSYTYSAWGTCQPDSTQTRTVIDSTPGGCLGTPVLVQKCNYTAPTCTYTYSAWGECQSNGTQTRTVLSSSPGGCVGIPVLTQNCVYVPPACTYVYSAWGTCQSNNTQTRTVVSSSPNPCSGNPILTQSCTYVPPVCTYVYSDWGPCVNNVQTRTVTSSSPNGCAGTPVLTQSCTTGEVTYGPHIYFVSPTGSDTYSATQAHSITRPFATLNKAWQYATAGDTIYMRGGTYLFNTQQVLSGKNGTAGNLIRVWAYPGEIPILSKSTSYTANYGIRFTGNYVHFKGLEITGYAQKTVAEGGGNVSSGFWCQDGSYNIYENLNVHHNGHGMVVRGDGGTSTGNLVLNCDFHHNQDPYTTSPGAYGNADGLDISYIRSGNTNTVQGCRAWWNTDDGFDCWQNEGQVIIKDCWSFYNGYIPDTWTGAGNGNGFKLGTTPTAQGTTIVRTVKNCVAYKNLTNGFDDNLITSRIEIYNTTSYLNGNNGYNLNYGTAAHIARNNVSYSNGNYDAAYTATSVVDHNTFLPGATHSFNIQPSDTDFVSLSSTGIDGARQSDGSLPTLTFLHLAAGSNLINTGTNVGLPYLGTNPDLGAFEKQ